MTCALDVEETAAGLERHRRGTALLVVAGVVALVLAVAVELLVADTWASDATYWLFAPGFLALCFGIGSWGNARRMRRTLGAGTWSAHPAVAIGSSQYATSVVLRSPDGAEAWPLTVITTRQRYELVRPGPDGVLWWCGDPRVGGVVTTPGSGPLIWAKPMRGGRVRRRSVARAEAEGLMRRAAPRQPQGPLSKSVPGPVPVTVDDPYDRIYTAPYDNLYDNPDADHEDSPDDSLYDNPDAGPEDRPDPSPDDRPDAGPGTSSSVRLDREPTPSGPTYAELAAHAQRQATPLGRGRAPRPEADVREVAWWRVRSLRRVAGVQRVLVALAFCAALGAAALTGPPKEDLLKLGVAGALALGVLVYSCYQLLTTGIPAARLTARAAARPGYVQRRYVLLYDPHGGAPVLVLFPMYGSGGAEAEGVLPLIPPGSQKEPRRGLPALPVGTVSLHGWQDFTPDDRMPFVVPWIDGRPLWPAGPYREADGRPDFTALLERLAPPLETQAS
ncbi:hypothetical protein [Streptomyces vietnamensis]|uniref:Uncharacterized protein n=1 Tax=Streptomyces vietnamensis TaxID=362257 RepID=A0A0B5HV78_9ACTN|nr:hypothetical protein [Streptomyces vietnamensis]AJF65935.1 hypothetical protein SVTN_17605 [Streptomyces vietnamensis]